MVDSCIKHTREALRVMAARASWPQLIWPRLSGVFCGDGIYGQSTVCTIGMYHGSDVAYQVGTLNVACEEMVANEVEC